MGNATRTAVACGVDIGSTNAKVVLIDAEGAVVARVIRPTPRDADGPLIDARALLAAIEQMILSACGDLYEVHAVSTAGIGEDGLLVDATLTPLTRALSWFDPRRQTVFRDLQPRLRGTEPFDADSDPVRTFVGWVWAREQLGATSAHRWISLTDLPAAHWSGRAFLSDTLASRTGAWHASDRRWDADRVTSTLGDVELLPPVAATGEIVGPLVSARLLEAGAVSAEAITVVGGHDHPIAGWGVDRMVPGALLDSMGTAEVVVAQTAAPPADYTRQPAIEIAPGIRSSGTTVLRVEELARNVQWASQNPEVAGHIRGLLDGSAQPLPVLDSGWFVPGAHGGGQPAYALDAPADPRARASAVLGALAIAGREAVEAVRRGGAGDGEVRLAGGWARSPGWIDIKNAVNGYRAAPVLEPQVTAVGAALLAAEALGWTPDPARALGGFAADLLG
ncbi:hypothetical protein GCM10027515_10350 [Schumannella luteola]|uniref:Xylulokinase n=1 Tax=Schumannella luteola TaxID=472059 RepID=A0A852Y850_9MICO|nr:xylulokinase [Schumannella luteola]TPX05901.1 hypothetical protein FJ656_04185 [Schumannella luteola]